MIGAWKQFFDGFIKRTSYEQRMNDYLGQAVSREHLEYLERQWFKNNKRH
jgi:hypothetical protein